MVATCVIFFVVVSLKVRTYYANNAPANTTTYVATWNMGYSPFWMLLNPAVPVANYVVKAYFGYSIADLGDTYKDNLPAAMYTLTQHWNTISILVNAGIALLFCWLAAKRINPLKKIKKHHTQKAQTAPVTEVEEVPKA